MGPMATKRRNNAARKINRSNLLRCQMARQRQSNLQISSSSWQRNHAKRTTQNHERSRRTNRMELTSIRQQTHQTRIHRKRLPATAPMERTRPHASSPVTVQIPIQQTRLRSTKTRCRCQSPTQRLPTLVRLHGRQQQSLARNENLSNTRRKPTSRPLRHPAAMDQQSPKHEQTSRIQLHQLWFKQPNQRRTKTTSTRQSPTLHVPKLWQTPNLQHLPRTLPNTHKTRQITI